MEGAQARLGGTLLDLEALANLGEFVSGVAVVVSLAWVAFQIRQNTRALRSENYARALDRVAEFQARLSGDSRFTELFHRGTVDPVALTPDERIQFSWAFYEMFGAFEFMFHQARSGALPDEVWKRWADTMAWWLSLPGVAAWWQARPAPFSAGFSAFVDARLRQGVSDPMMARRWAAFLATGRPPGDAPPA